MSAPGAWAGEESVDGAIVFDIPVQPLASALDAYGVATGRTAVYNGNLAAGRMSGAVKGAYTPETALRLLLRDSGLVAEYSTASAFVLVPAPSGSGGKTPAAIAAAALARQDAIEQGFSGLVQFSIERALCGSPSTKPGDYRLALSFRIDPIGDIADLKLLSSTGDPNRDAAIATTLKHLSVGSPAPAAMAQPFTMLVLPNASGGIVDCPPVGEGP